MNRSLGFVLALVLSSLAVSLASPPRALGQTDGPRARPTGVEADRQAKMAKLRAASNAKYGVKVSVADQRIKEHNELLGKLV